MEHRVTIKEIAAEAGVSTGTVHRALYGKKGLSEQTRQQILDLCARRGYRANSAASALKRSALRIAAAFPGPQEENSYFYGSVWHGFRRCMAELDDYNLEVLELPYYPGTERGQAETLNACFEQYGGKIDALLTVGPTEDTARRAVQRYSSAGTPVFFACDDAEGCGRIACVQADHDMAGRIAAELLSAQLSPGDAVLLCAGDAHTPSHYRMAAGFEAYLRENSVPLTLVRADGYHDKQELALRLRRTLAEDARISGAFSVSARLSVLLADAPMGKYHPDWAIVFKQKLSKYPYFIAETKASDSSLQDRRIEEAKIECAKKHFAKTNGGKLKYNKVSSFEDLLKIVTQESV